MNLLINNILAPSLPLAATPFPPGFESELCAAMELSSMAEVSCVYDVPSDSH